MVTTVAELRRIEEMYDKLKSLTLPTAPEWIQGYTKRDGHLSGALREAEERFFGTTDESVKELLSLLEEAAETLDDAHQEWMETQIKNHCAFACDGKHMCQWCKR